MIKLKAQIENVPEIKITKVVEKFGKKIRLRWKTHTKDNITILECELPTLRSKIELLRRLRVLKNSKIKEYEIERVFK